MKITGIYQIQSKIKPDRIYIGSAINIKNRQNQHLCYLKQNKHHSEKLQRHFNKYGISDLQFSIVLGCEKEDLIKIEQYYLDSYKPYFNNCQIAGSRLGSKASEETKRKMSNIRKGKPFKGKSYFIEYNKTLKGKKHTIDHNKKISDSLRKGKYSRPKSLEWREKIRQSLLGKYKQPKSEEHKLKISISKIGKKRLPFSEEWKRKMSEAQKRRYSIINKTA